MATQMGLQDCLFVLLIAWSKQKLQRFFALILATISKMCIGLTKVHKMLIFNVLTYRETLSRNTMGDPLI